LIQTQLRKRKLAASTSNRWLIISRAGRYRVQHLIEQRGRKAKLIDWLDEITADCPRKQAHNMNDRCGARFPD
jgi:hypothetical protein